ncbi:MAG: SIS domain-containing protein [Desulfobacterales bacterium]|nr:SIS domain-containing protein [Desulfobacterales bacterium]
MRIVKTGAAPVFFARPLSAVPEGAVVFFPLRQTCLCCGLAGMVAVKAAAKGPAADLAPIEEMIRRMGEEGAESCRSEADFTDRYLCGKEFVASLVTAARGLKADGPFFDILTDPVRQNRLSALGRQIADVIEAEQRQMAARAGRLGKAAIDVMDERIEMLRDVAWIFSTELLGNVEKLHWLRPELGKEPDRELVRFFRRINAVLNSIERLEVRGRDSAGISILVTLAPEDYYRFMETLDRQKLANEVSDRLVRAVLSNRSIHIREGKDENGRPIFSVGLTYKIAAEIGSLGDNTRFLREQIRNDRILQLLAPFPRMDCSILSHTRWASVGAITEANCHPMDNLAEGDGSESGAIIHVCLNGDIDNYMELKKGLENEGVRIPAEISTDTKLIPLQIARYLAAGDGIYEAFRRAANDFEGSHAIAMHSDLAPGKLFLAQKGSGQAIFVGLGSGCFLPASEVYGFVEETSRYLKLDGESVVEGPNGRTQGQIVVLGSAGAGELAGIEAMHYDGTPIELTSGDVHETVITSRDIDRQNFPHYFLKEISESPRSVEKTLLNRWQVDGEGRPQVVLDGSAVPPEVRDALAEGAIRRIYFIGQGTAGVAASVCAGILDYYLSDPSVQVSALKASELSGSRLCDNNGHRSLSDALIVAISQSGTTTDTNRTVDLVRERGAFTLAIVNRRDSDLTFKTDGTIYTSSGRDVEMSVASTKAFYAQIVAGALLGLYIAALRRRRSAGFVGEELQQLLALPVHMRTVLGLGPAIEASAKRLAAGRTYWAAVGSGPNKAAADEIRIKLSELCYKTISSDYVEDKKHIDLSSEPLIIVCAAGARPSVIGDIIKDTAIFKAHKAAPVVIADEGEERFGPYAEDVFQVPAVGEHLSPILNTLVGHLWGYHAALAINDGSRMLYRFREEVRQSVEASAEKGLDVYESILERPFREKIASFYRQFRSQKISGKLPGILGIEAASDLTLLLKYLSGRLPVSDFELDFGVKGTALNMLNRLFSCLGEAINAMARPVDAIKHQAKTVTVGTSRIQEKLEGILFSALEEHGISPSQLINRNILVLKNLQGIVSEIRGSILYRVRSLDLLGEPTEQTAIEVVRKGGTLKPIPSRVERDHRLKGTKRIIVKEGNVYIGKGRKDDRSIVVIPAISTSPETPNLIEHLLLLHIGFTADVSLEIRIKALGGKYERIKNIAQENSVAWDDRLLDQVEMEELFGRSAEKIAEFIVSKVNGGGLPPVGGEDN